MSSTLTSVNKEYQWKSDGTDGLRSYSYAKSNPNWSYNTKPDNSDKDDDGAYLFFDSSTGQPSARRGNLYNWTAATLGSGLKVSSGQAPDSICPSGWQLPTDGSRSTDKTFTRLLSIYTINSDVASWNRFVSYPLEYLPAGYYSTGYVYGRTTDGYWWTGKIESTGRGYYLETSTGYVNGTTDGSSNMGLALREVAQYFSLHSAGRTHHLCSRYLGRR